MKSKIALGYLLIILSLIASEFYLRWRPERVAASPQARQHLGSYDMPYERHKAPGQFRVLVIGDSYVFGPGLKPKERFTAVLESYYSRLEVVTIALMGANTPMEFDGWKQYGDVGADLVILAIALDDNDLGLIERPEPDEIARRLAPTSRLAEWADERFFFFQSFGSSPFEQVLNRHEATDRLWKGILEKFRLSIEAYGAEPWALVLAQPFFEDESETLAANEYAAGAAQQAGFTTFNFLPIYRQHYGDLTHSRDRWATPHDAHYNAETHQVVAQFLWEHLNPYLP